MFYSILEQSDWFASLDTIIEIHLRSRYHMAWNFGGLLKLWHLAEFTWRSLAIMIFIAKWLIERGGNFTGPWASFHRSYHSDAETENRLPIFLGKWPTTTPASVFKATSYLRCPKPLETWYPCTQLLMVNSMLTITLERPAAGLFYTWKLWLRIMMTAHCKVFADETLVGCSQNRQSTKINSPPKFPAIRCSG